MKATLGVVSGSRTYQGPINLLAGTMVIQGAADGTIALPTAANQQIIGVVKETDIVGTGTYAIARNGEEAYILCGAAIAAPGYFKSDANGHAIPSTAIGDFVAGAAVSSTVNAGDEFVGLLNSFIR